MEIVDIDKFFQGKSIELSLFEAVKDLVSSFGQFRVKATKTQVAFSAKRQFAWVWLPMPSAKNRPAHSIVLSFSLGRRIEHPQIIQVVEPYPGRWMHHVIVEKDAGLTSEVKSWLEEAYTFGSEITG